MIRFRDALMLARTKRRTRKLRTGITITIAGLLFGILMLALFLTGGVTRSVADMTEKSMSGRYIVNGTQGMVSYNPVNWEDPELIKRATDRHVKLVADKTREAKRLGIGYDATISDPLPYQVIDGKTGKKGLSMNSAIAQQVVAEAEREGYPVRSLDDFKKFAEKYSPSTYYVAQPFVAKDGAIEEMQNGKEALKSERPDPMAGGMPDDYQQATLAPSGLLKNYLFDARKWKPESGAIPVLVTQKRAAKLTNFEQPGKEASAEDRLRYMTRLRDRVNGATFSMCYRNSKSQELVSEAVAIQKELTAQAGNKQYQKPSLIYGLPDDTSCGAVSIQSDTRTAAEKNYAAKQKEFDAIFGAITEPVQRKITYEVVGMLPNGFMDMEGGQNLIDASALVDMLFLGANFRFAIPSDLYSQLPKELGYDSLFATSNTYGYVPAGLAMNDSQYFAEFTEAEKARAFARNETCTFGPNGCATAEKWFSLSSFGSNSIALDDAGKFIEKVLTGVGLAVMAVAAIICGATIGRAIADGRRETAVFRAIGFKRIDISQIYTVYMVLLCIDIAIFALFIGAAGALLFDNLFWIDATARARLLLGVYDDSSTFRFIGLLPQHLYVIGAIIATGVIGMLLPLIRNVRRNPIRDMRDE